MVQKTTEISCPSCRTVYRVPNDYFDTGMKKTRCSVCGHLFIIKRSASENKSPDMDGEEPRITHNNDSFDSSSDMRAIRENSVDEEAEIFLTGSFVAFDPNEMALSGADELFSVAESSHVASIDEDSIFSTSSSEVSGVDEIFQMSRNEPFGIGQSVYTEIEEKEGNATDFDFKKIGTTEESVTPEEDGITPKGSYIKQTRADESLESSDSQGVVGMSLDGNVHPEADKLAIQESEEEQPPNHVRENDDQEFELLAAALDETSDGRDSDISSDIDIADRGIDEDEHETFDFDEGDTITEAGDSDFQGEEPDITAFDEVDLDGVEFGVSDEEGTEEPETHDVSIGESSDTPFPSASEIEEIDAQEGVKDESKSWDDEFSLKEQYEDKFRLELDPFRKSKVKDDAIGIDDTLAQELSKLDDGTGLIAEEPPRFDSEETVVFEPDKKPIVVEEPEKTPEKPRKIEKGRYKKPEVRRARPTIENAIKPETVSGHIYQIGVLVAGLGSYATIIFGRPAWQFDPLWASSLVALGVIGFFMQGLSGLLLAGIFSFFYPLALFSRQMDVIVGGTFSGLFVIGAQILLSFIFLAVYFFTMERKGDHFLPKPGVGLSLMSLLFGLLAIIAGLWAHVYTNSIPPLEQVLIMGFSIGNLSFYSGVSLPVLIQALLLSLAIATGFTARAMRNRLLVFAYIGVVFGFLVLLLLFARLVFGEIRIMLPV